MPVGTLPKRGRAAIRCCHIAIIAAGVIVALRVAHIVGEHVGVARVCGVTDASVEALPRTLGRSYWRAEHVYTTIVACEGQ